MAVSTFVSVVTAENYELLDEDVLKCTAFTYYYMVKFMGQIH
jgi:hypothetical protein